MTIVSVLMLGQSCKASTTYQMHSSIRLLKWGTEMYICLDRGVISNRSSEAFQSSYNLDSRLIFPALRSCTFASVLLCLCLCSSPTDQTEYEPTRIRRQDFPDVFGSCPALQSVCSIKLSYGANLAQVFDKEIMGQPSQMLISVSRSLQFMVRRATSNPG